MLRPIKPYVDYVLNYEYISTVLCINKDKPEMECNGKCHLVKQVSEQQSEDLKTFPIQIKDYPIGFVNLFSIQKNKMVVLQSFHKFFYHKNYSFLHEFSVFHPPNFFI